MTERGILTLNAGSSSLKFALFTTSGHPRRLWSGAIDRIGLPGAHFLLNDARRTVLIDEPGSIDNHRTALTRLLQAIANLPGSLDLVAVGHRFVHGGSECYCPKRVTPALVARLRRLSALAPLHLPANLAGIKAVQEARPDLPQVTCFDTSFHQHIGDRRSLCMGPSSAICGLGSGSNGFPASVAHLADTCDVSGADLDVCAAGPR